MENRSQYKNRLISPSRRQQFNARKLRKLKAGEIEGVIFNIAYQLRGRITLSDIIIETGLSMKESEEVINKMVDSVRVRMEVDENGLVIYEFPEIIARFQNGTDH